MPATTIATPSINTGRSALKYRSGLLVGLLCLFLTACDDDDDKSTNISISGTAAVGAPIVGTVTANCADGSGFIQPVPTSAEGRWRGFVKKGVLPCALKVSWGEPAQSLYSYTETGGIVNITPLTDLALALAINTATGQNTGDWFTTPASGKRNVTTELSNALDDLRSKLSSAGFSLPSGWTAGSSAPFTLPFTPNPVSDAFDRLLEDLAEAISHSTSYDNYADLLEAIVSGADLPDAPEPETPAPVCTIGDDKLVFTDAPDDFCGFTKQASANTIDNYYQFTSSSGSNGTTWVKFTLTGNDTIGSIMIENDAYAFNCGTGSSTLCTGATVTTDANSNKQFRLNNTPFAVVSGATQPITVNGLLIHLSGGTSPNEPDTETPVLAANEFGVRFASTGTVMGTAETGAVRFIDSTGNVEISDNLLHVNAPDSKNSAFYLDLRWLPNTTGSYACGDGLSAGNNQKTIALAYAANNGYSSLDTKGLTGFECKLNITRVVGDIKGYTHTGYIEGNFKARLFKTGAQVNLATSVLVAGSFRLGTQPAQEPGNDCTAADDKLVFTNAPDDFCGFTKASSNINAPDNEERFYQFWSGADGQGTLVQFYYQNGNLTTVLIENESYQFLCSNQTDSAYPDCTGISMKEINNHTEFQLNGTTLAATDDTQPAEPYISVNGLLIHPGVSNPTEPEQPDNNACDDNSNPFGCVTISGIAAPVKFFSPTGYDIGTQSCNHGTPTLSGLTSNIKLMGHMQYGTQCAPVPAWINAGLSVGTVTFGSNDMNHAGYKFQNADSKTWYEFTCNNDESAQPECTGLSIDYAAKSAHFNNVTLKQAKPAGESSEIVLNGTIKFEISAPADTNVYTISNGSDDTVFNVSRSNWEADDGVNVFTFIDESLEGTAANRLIEITFSGMELPATGSYQLTNILAEGGSEPVTTGKVRIMGVGTGGIISIGSGSLSVTNEGGIVAISGTDIDVKTFTMSARKLSLNLQYP